MLISFTTFNILAQFKLEVQTGHGFVQWKRISGKKFEIVDDECFTSS